MAINRHVLPRWSYIHDSALDCIVVVGLPNGYLAESIEPPGERSGEASRHVLDNQNADRQVGRQKRQDFLKGLWSARGNPDCNDAGRNVHRTRAEFDCRVGNPGHGPRPASFGRRLNFNNQVLAIILDVK
jgi:hypothetical protein